MFYEQNCVRALCSETHNNLVETYNNLVEKCLAIYTLGIHTSIQFRYSRFHCKWSCVRALCSETHNHIITLWRPLTHILPCGVDGSCAGIWYKHLECSYMEVFSYLQVGYCLNVPFNYYIHTVQIQSFSVNYLWTKLCESIVFWNT